MPKFFFSPPPHSGTFDPLCGLLRFFAFPGSSVTSAFAFVCFTVMRLVLCPWGGSSFGLLYLRTLAACLSGRRFRGLNGVPDFSVLSVFLALPGAAPPFPKGPLGAFLLFLFFVLKQPPFEGFPGTANPPFPIAWYPEHPSQDPQWVS